MRICEELAATLKACEPSCVGPVCRGVGAQQLLRAQVSDLDAVLEDFQQYLGAYGRRAA